MEQGISGARRGTVVQVSSEEGKSHVLVAMEQQKFILWLLFLMIILLILSTGSSLLCLERLGALSSRLATHEIMLASNGDRFQNALAQAKKESSSCPSGGQETDLPEIIPQ